MSYKLIIRKLYLEKERFIKSDLIREYCKKLSMDYYAVIRYLTYNKYVIRILRGIFYKPTIEERKYNSIKINHFDAISEALRIKNIKNWYFGLETAIKLNKLTHEYFTITYILSDKIFRAKPFDILGNKVKFIKIKKELFTFGIKKNKFPYSDIEKTVLDIIYLSKYDGLSDEEIKSKIADLLNYCIKSKLMKYSIRYNKEVDNFVGGLI